jgi:predicted transcriptional regulator
MVSYVSNNAVASADLPNVIASIYAALARIAEPKQPKVPKQEPAVSIRLSVKPDYLVCLEDGKKLKMLKRYIRTRFDLSPEAYRSKWDLPSDYPMVAPSYAERRRDLAKSIGLGKLRATAPVAATAEPSEPPASEAPKARRKLSLKMGTVETAPAAISKPSRVRAKKAVVEAAN